MTTEELRALLLELDPMVHAEGVPEWIHGIGGDAVKVYGCQTYSLSSIIEAHGWESATEQFWEVRHLIDDWPEILLAWKDKL